jgi:hypothetical protein
MTCVRRRFRVPPPKNKSDEVVLAWRNQTQRPIHCRVFNMCKAWITKYLYDSDAVRDEAFVNRFLAFLDEMSAVRTRTHTLILLAHIFYKNVIWTSGGRRLSAWRGGSAQGQADGQGHSAEPTVQPIGHERTKSPPAC